MSLKFTIMGCGSSGGVPRIGNNWGACNPDNPKNRRRRSGFLVERISDNGRTTVIVDTSPDLREQLLSSDVQWIDGVLYTHEHADHTHGIDDLRVVALNGKRQGRGRVDVYMNDRTRDSIVPRFSYCFESPPHSPYPPILNACKMQAYEVLTIEGDGGPIEALPIIQQHGAIQSMGFRFENVAYCTDLNDFPEEALPHLEGLEVLILDALRHNPHVSHLTVNEALQWIDRLKPQRAILTDLHVDLDYDALAAILPKYVEPAYDGMVIEL